MKVVESLEIVDNDFLRQYEARIDGELVKLEYSAQPRKIFLTKFIICEELKNQGYDEVFLKTIFDKFSEDEAKIVPTCPEVARFFKAHKSEYRKLLPTGINM